MGRSLESSRPILANSATTSVRDSQRYSTYSNTASLAPTVDTTSSSSTATTADPRVADIKSWNAGFDRLEDKRLQQQRYVPSAQKNDDMGKLALGAKVERALGRRLTGQDAVFREGRRIGTAVVSEKAQVEGAAS